MGPLSEDSDLVMSAFHECRPCFYNEDDDNHCNFNLGSCVSEEVWKKFELIPTPPRSPEHYGGSDSDTPKDADDQILNNGYDLLSQVSGNLEDIYSSEESKKSWRWYSESKANFSDDGKENCPANSEENMIKKDCMWNGAGHKPHSEVTRANRCLSSPSMPIENPANGCVDPRSVFSKLDKIKKVSFNQSFTPINKYLDGADSPSDSGNFVYSY